METGGELAKWRVQSAKPGPNPKVFPMLKQRRKKFEKQREVEVYAIMVQREPRLSYRDVMVEAAMNSTHI